MWAFGRKSKTIPISIFLEGTASPDVPDLWGLCLHSVSDVPWQQDVRVSQLLHGFLQSPQVHFLQRKRPAAMRELQQVRMLSAWPNILTSLSWVLAQEPQQDCNTGSEVKRSSTLLPWPLLVRTKWICNKICEFVDLLLLVILCVIQDENVFVQKC